MIEKITNKSIAIFLLISSFVFILIGYFTSGTYDSGDSTYHFLHAQYALKYPELLLNHWAKPLFTLISVPFAQFGFFGMKVMNTIIILLSIWFTFLSARLLNYKYAALIPVFLFPASAFMLSMYSGLTEPMFALFLSLGLYFSLCKKPIHAAIIISFLPFIRTEGQIIMIVYTVYYLFNKQWKIIPLLLVGNIIYGFVGLIFKNDFLFTFHENSYATGEDNYGSGGPFHFIKQLGFHIGFPLYGLFLLGLIYFIFQLRKPKLFFKQTNSLELFFLVIGVYASFFISDTIFWWQGLFHSLGLPRVLTSIVPVGSIICLMGFTFLKDEILGKWQKISLAFSYLLLAYIIIFPFSGNKAGFNFKKDFSLDDQQKELTELADWYSRSGIKADHFYLAHQYFCIPMNIDPFDAKIKSDMDKYNADSVISNSLLVWDQWYAPIEFNIDLDTLENNPKLKLVKTMISGDKNNPYVIKVFYKK